MQLPSKSPLPRRGRTCWKAFSPSPPTICLHRCVCRLLVQRRSFAFSVTGFFFLALTDRINMLDGIFPISFSFLTPSATRLQPCSPHTHTLFKLMVLYYGAVCTHLYSSVLSRSLPHHLTLLGIIIFGPDPVIWAFRIQSCRWQFSLL